MTIKKIIRPVLLVILSVLVAGFCLGVASQPARAEAAEVNLFYSPTCPHCTKERAFLDVIENKYPQIKVNRFNVTEAGSVDKLKEFYGKYKVPEDSWGLVPVTFIADKFFLGFSDSTAKEIENCLTDLCQVDISAGGATGDSFTRWLSLPFGKQIDVSKFSPLTLSIVVGFLDGFNVCSMMALIFLLTAMASTGRRRKVILVGGVFILVSGLIYFLFISAWLNLFLFLGYIKIITVGVAVLIIIFAALLLKEYFANIICKLCDVKEEKESFFVKAQKRLFTQMIKLSAAEMPLILTLLGVALVAIGVNTIELMCSLGFPMAYTKILAGHHLATAAYYFYLFIYIFFYMLIEFVIFLAAVVTLRVVSLSDKYFKAIKLVSGIILLLLGLAMLFRPELLNFG
ncbi:MAG: hypothetical protein WC518_00575 [Patescibacteria group bacterium]